MTTWESPIAHTLQNNTRYTVDRFTDSTLSPFRAIPPPLPALPSPSAAACTATRMAEAAAAEAPAVRRLAETVEEKL